MILKVAEEDVTSSVRSGQGLAEPAVLLVPIGVIAAARECLGRARSSPEHFGHEAQGQHAEDPAMAGTMPDGSGQQACHPRPGRPAGAEAQAARKTAVGGRQRHDLDLGLKIFG